jgi:RNA polymerase sigma-70 factor (ECF subfamily)
MTNCGRGRVSPRRLKRGIASHADLAKEEVYAKYSEELVRFATGLVGPSDAEDVVSSAVLSVMYSKTWTAVQNPRAYLYRSVLNEARQYWRTVARRQLREYKAAPPEAWDAENAHPEVLDIVRDLSMRQRAVIVLTYWADLEPSRIAALLGISEGAVKRHLARARVHLKERLRDES